jgi:hypothetical protein
MKKETTVFKTDLFVWPFNVLMKPEHTKERLNEFALPSRSFRMRIASDHRGPRARVGADSVSSWTTGRTCRTCAGQLSIREIAPSDDQAWVESYQVRYSFIHTKICDSLFFYHKNIRKSGLKSKTSIVFDLNFTSLFLFDLRNYRKSNVFGSGLILTGCSPENWARKRCTWGPCLRRRCLPRLLYHLCVKFNMIRYDQSSQRANELLIRKQRS